MALGKRRREQLGIQTPSDRQHQPISGSESAAVGSNWLAGPTVAAGDRAASSSGADSRGGGGVAESMMQKWGYTQGLHLFLPSLPHLMFALLLQEWLSRFALLLQQHECFFLRAVCLVLVQNACIQCVIGLSTHVARCGPPLV